MGCDTEGSDEIIKLFEESDYIYGVHSWESVDSSIITTHSFIINGVDTIPIFPSREEAISQLQGSKYLDRIVGIEPKKLARLLQSLENGILNPGSKAPILFKTCIVKKISDKNFSVPVKTLPSEDQQLK